MAGYLSQPADESGAVDTDGYLRTGDAGYVDSDGFFFYTDRIKEIFKVRGFQVSPAELEALLLTSEAIADAAVVGVADPVAGEVPKAFVVRRSGHETLTAEEVKAFLEVQVTAYKQLREVQFVTSLPRSASGKLLRRKLRDETWGPQAWEELRAHCMAALSPGCGAGLQDAIARAREAGVEAALLRQASHLLVAVKKRQRATAAQLISPLEELLSEAVEEVLRHEPSEAALAPVLASHFARVSSARGCPDVAANDAYDPTGAALRASRAEVARLEVKLETAEAAVWRAERQVALVPPPTRHHFHPPETFDTAVRDQSTALDSLVLKFTDQQRRTELQRAAAKLGSSGTLDMSACDTEVLLEAAMQTSGNMGLDADTPLMYAGIGSLHAMVIRGRVQAALGSSVSVPSMLLYDFPTARLISQHLKTMMVANTLVLPILSEVTGLPIANISADSSIYEQGLDSLGQAEFSLRLNQLTKLDLSPSDFFSFLRRGQDHATPLKIASLVLEDIDVSRIVVGATTKRDAAERPASTTSTRAFLQACASVTTAAQGALISELSTELVSSSRTGYLRALNDLVGPRPSGLWRDEWDLLESEHARLFGKKQVLSFSEAIERYRPDIDGHMANGWEHRHAQAFACLSMRRAPISQTLHEGSPRFAASVYALFDSLVAARALQPRPLKNALYYHLKGTLSLSTDDPAWLNVERPDRTGFYGLSSFATIKAYAEPECFTEAGFSPRVVRSSGAIERIEPQKSEMVCFLNEEDDEQGEHAAVQLDANGLSGCFPPNTLFRLRDVHDGFTAPNGIRMEQRLLVMSATFRLPSAADSSGDGLGKLCGSVNVLQYADRKAYVRGLIFL